MADLQKTLPAMARRWLRAAAGFKRQLQGTDAKLIRSYLDAAAEPKLHIGGGPRCLDGWLNSDLFRAPGVVQFDATRAFPLPDNRFAFVFSEHMIEHVGYGEALGMLRECLRVMRPGGTIRIVTPDLRAILALLDRPWTPIQQDYFEYFCRHFIPRDHPRSPASLANAMFRTWGHTFLHDEETLRMALEEAGFVDVVRFRLGESKCPQLQGLEHEDRYPPGLLDLESLALEAVKPPPKAQNPPGDPIRH